MTRRIPRDPILQIQGNNVTIDNVTFAGDRAKQLPTFAHSWNGRCDSPAILIDPPVPPSCQLASASPNAKGRRDFYREFHGSFIGSTLR